MVPEAATCSVGHSSCSRQLKSKRSYSYFIRRSRYARSRYCRSRYGTCSRTTNPSTHCVDDKRVNVTDLEDWTDSISRTGSDNIKYWYSISAYRPLSPELNVSERCTCTVRRHDW